MLSDKLTNFPYQLILGSASPRRKQLIEGLGFLFSVFSIDADESFPADLKRENIPLFLAKKKADAYPNELREQELLITSDTIVWCNDKVLNKPNDRDEAMKMLKELSGKMHEVYTAVHLRSSLKSESFYETSKVYFKDLTDEEIEYYIEKHEPFDKAGSYGVQDWMGYVGIEKIEGNFYTIMGLPTKMLYEKLMNF